MKALSESCPECFGSGVTGEKCSVCEYADSCRFSAEDEERTRTQDSRWNGTSEYFDSHDYRKNWGDPLPVDISDNRTYSRDEVVALSAFLLRVGRDRKLGKLLAAKLMGAKSFAEMARKEGVTRQAIHKRIGKQLAKIFGYKNRRLTDSRLLTLEPEEFRLLKLTRAGIEDKEIEGILALPHAEYRRLRETLDWKLMRWT